MIDKWYFKNQPGIFAIFTGRKEGDMRPRINGEAFINPNFSALFQQHSISLEDVIIPRLKHENRVTIVTNKTKADVESDALVTDLVGKFSAITAADCYSTYLLDPKTNPNKRKIGLAHCGWAPLVGSILLWTVSAMESIGATAENILARVSPGICQPCYAWKRDDLWRLEKYNGSRYVLDVLDNYKKVRVDLKGIIRDQLIESGIKIGNITFSKECTCCNQRKFFTARKGEEDDTSKEPGDKERQLAVIGMTG